MTTTATVADELTTVWRPVPGFDGYEVSNDGRVRSWRLPYRWGEDRKRRSTPYVLKQFTTEGVYWRVGIRALDEERARQMLVHVLVAAAFIGPRPDGQVVRHLNGDARDNRPANLAYGTATENNLDTVRHGRNRNAAKTHCANGHEFTPENTYVHQGWRHCKTCRRAVNRAWDRRRRERSEA